MLGARSLKISARSFSSLPKRVRIVEVGLRDGLQNEPKPVPTEAKLELLRLLANSGLKTIEAGSFVSPKWVPQMGDTPKIFAELQKTAESSYPGITFTALTPNLKGLESALELGVKEVAVFGAASEAFSQKNINCSIAESINRFQDVMTKARAHNVKVRGYVSCVLGCPYEGAVSPDKVLEVSQRLLDMGCYEISLGDTIGVGQAGSTKRLLDVVMKKIPRENLAVHFHDTYGQALSNILVALDHGIEVLDSSVSGLGGCPYAKGASGNVATEDVLYMLQGLGIQTGVDLNQVIKAGMYIDGVLSRSSQSKVNKALSPKVASS
eukprot:gene13387-9586_t